VWRLCLDAALAGINANASRMAVASGMIFFIVVSLGVRDVSNYPVNHCISARNKRLLNQSYPWVVKDPHAEVPVGRDDVDGIHRRLLDAH